MIKLLSLFSGIGAYEEALTRGGYEHKIVNYCEINKYASKAYSMIHNIDESLNLHDVTKIDTSLLPKDIDILTYSAPCTDISLCGKLKGFFNDDGTPTRTGLFFDALKVIKETQPKIAISENVSNLTSKRFKDQFNLVLAGLEESGYNNYWQILNAKNYGIPQNRNRVFIISIRKDIDDGRFEFPKPFELTTRLKDLLEEDVDEKYFLSDKMIEYICAENDKWITKDAIINKDVAVNINTKEGSRRCDASNYISDDLPDNADLRCVGTLRGSGLPWDKMYEQSCRIYSSDGILPTIDTMGGGNRQPKILIKNATKKGYLEGEDGDGRYINNIKGKRGTVQKGMIQIIKTSGNDIGVITKVKDKQGKELSLNTHYNKLIDTINKNNLPIGEVKHMDSYNRRLTDNCGTLTDPCHNTNRLWDGLRIRKLTPRECFRCMGFSDERFDKIKDEFSNTQLYKMAGNSIVVNVLEEIFKEIFKRIKF